MGNIGFREYVETCGQLSAIEPELAFERREQMFLRIVEPVRLLASRGEQRSEPIAGDERRIDGSARRGGGAAADGGGVANLLGDHARRGEQKENDEQRADAIDRTAPFGRIAREALSRREAVDFERRGKREIGRTPRMKKLESH